MAHTRWRAVRDPQPLRYFWRMSHNRSSLGIAEVGSDILYVSRKPGSRGRASPSFTGRINGVIVVDGAPTIWVAKRETERVYVERASGTA